MGVNAKDSARSVIQVIKEFMDMKKDCTPSQTDQRACAQDAVRVAAALASVGQYLSGAFAHCVQPGTSAKDAQCAQGSLQLLDHTAKVAGASIDLSRRCGSNTSAYPTGIPLPVTKLFATED